MEVKASIVHVYRPLSRHRVINDDHLLMDEARSVLIDFDAGLKQRPIVALGELEDEFLIRDARNQYSHVGPLQSRDSYGLAELFVQDEIRSRDISVISGLAHDREINALADLFIRIRHGAIWLNEAIAHWEAAIFIDVGLWAVMVIVDLFFRLK